MEYITVREMAEKWGISARLVQKYCADGRVAGAMKFGRSWKIPCSAVKPQDPRRQKEERKEQSGQPDLCLRQSVRGKYPACEVCPG